MHKAMVHSQIQGYKRRSLYIQRMIECGTWMESDKPIAAQNFWGLYGYR